MKSLKELYIEIAKESSRWSYYSDPPMLYESIWSNCSEAYTFIKSYYNLAGKGRTFEDKHITDNEKDIKERATHVVSTFLLGILIAETLGIDTQQRNYENMNFLYYWFLAALYHDVGYIYEKNSNSYDLKKIEEKGLQEILDICDINPDNMSNSIFLTYTSRDIEEYSKQRARGRENSEGKVDHGIVGGLMLYDKLVKQFYIARRKRLEGYNKDDFYIWSHGKKLHLSKSHFKEYAKVSDAIIAHNIFKDTLIKCYENDETKKEELSQKVIHINNELCFVLAISDTIEPLKKGLSLDKVYFEGFDQGFIVKFDKYLCKDFVESKKFVESIESLKEWVSVEITKEIESDLLSFQIIPK